MRRTIKRSELYELVWKRPVTKVAQEIGISDVGLSKICARYGIPVPPRGHWVKIASGRKSPIARLPSPGKDFIIDLPPRSQREPETDDDAHRLRASIISTMAEDLRETLTVLRHTTCDTDPIVKSTLAYIEKIPILQRRYDRLLERRRLQKNVDLPYLHKGVRQLNSRRAIGMLVSDEFANQALELHQLIIRILESRGCRFGLEKRTMSPGYDLTCELFGEKVFLRLSESSGRHRFTAEELKEAMAEGRNSIDWEWRGGKKVTWILEGTESSLQFRWVERKADLVALIPEICATCLYTLEIQPSVRQTRMEDEVRRRREAGERERQRRAAQSRREQVELGLEMAKEYERTLRLKTFLDHFEAERMSYQEPYPERIRVWVQTVREELDRNPSYLREFGKAFHVTGWEPGPPNWWPQDVTWTAAGGN